MQHAFSTFDIVAFVVASILAAIYIEIRTRRMMAERRAHVGVLVLEFRRDHGLDRPTE